MAELAPSSNACYESCIRIMKNASVDPMNTETTTAWILENKKAKTTQKNYFSALQYWLKPLDGSETQRTFYRNKIRELATEIIDHYESQQLSEREAVKFAPWSEIQTFVKKILENVDVLDVDKLLIRFYIEMPPVRLDYSNLAIHKSAPTEDKGNYIVVYKSSTYVVINDHKTSKTYGALRKTLPAPLARSVRLFLKLNPEMTVLFPYSQKSLGKRIVRIFKTATDKYIGVGVLRHSYVSDFLSKAPSLKACRALARDMGHSVLLQQHYRRLEQES
jgi:hypothetical protein